MELFSQLAIGLIFSSLIGLLAHRRRSLSGSGVVGAVIVGTAIFGFGGWAWGLTLITFFVTSSLLSHYKALIKEKLAEKFDKGHQRDLGQVLANGGAGAIIAGIYAIQPNPLLLAAFAGAMATVNADTWATELGVLAKKPPRLITTGREVEVGTSGAVSLLGMLASMGGSLVIGVALAGFLALESTFVGGRYIVPLLPLVGAALVGGLTGSLFDSLLGATVQAIYHCPNCHKDTEKTLHTCGTSTHLVRGRQWLNNDVVNLISSLLGASVAVACWYIGLSPN
ncbi:MAG: DUF92 domain-containing protein [Anaerolineae bacterium]|nr:DUF92 domain-containing protein [Anaerolineae bacterium]